MPVVTHKTERPDGSPLPGIPGRIEQNPPGLWEGDDRHLLHVDVTTDAAGAFSVTLPASADLTPAGSNYQLDMLGETLSFVVPSGAGPFTIHDTLVDPPGTVDQSALNEHLIHHPAGTPASTVVSEQTYGQAPAVGVGGAYAREDHSHGTPSLGSSGTTAAAGNHTHPPGGVKAVKVVPVESGNISITSASWQAIGPDITIPAATGDVLKVSPAFLGSTGADMEADLAVIITGNPARYLSSRTATQETNGFGGWYLAPGNLQFANPASLTVEADDVISGNVTVRILGKSVGVTRVLFAGATVYPALITVENLGPATA